MTMNDILPLLIAILLGGIIGIEREINGKPAGLRTNIIICLGAAAFTIIARYLSADTESATRVTAGIVTGVGFLGAGVLIHEGGGIHGLTTAASIWLVTSIGIACGAGLYILAVAVTVLAVVVLLGLQPITKKIREKYAGHSDED